MRMRLISRRTFVRDQIRREFGQEIAAVGA